jgi:hypothetical protein
VTDSLECHVYGKWDWKGAVGFRLNVARIRGRSVCVENEARTVQFLCEAQRLHGAAVDFACDEDGCASVGSLQPIAMNERSFRGRFAWKPFAGDRTTSRYDFFFEPLMFRRIRDT